MKERVTIIKLPLNDLKVTSEYGVTRSNGKIHKGIDLISITGDRNVRTIKRGTVSFVGYDKTGFGNYVVILQEDNYKALYCHLKNYNVVAEQKIEEGQIIGIEGTSGNSTGVHLHLEIRRAPYKRNDHINVANYLGIKNKKGKVEVVEKEKRYQTLEEIPEWGKSTVEKLVNLEILKGNENGLDLSEDMLRILVMHDRLKLYD